MLGLFALVAALLAALGGASSSPASSTSGWHWFKTDTHVHTVVSGDAVEDAGILSQSAQAKGYNALFVTDHQAASNFAISTVVANHVVFEDSFRTKCEDQTQRYPLGICRRACGEPGRQWHQLASSARDLQQFR